MNDGLFKKKYIKKSNLKNKEKKLTKKINKILIFEVTSFMDEP